MYKITSSVAGGGMDLSVNSAFSRTIHDLINIRRPLKLLETGTHFGTGSTRIICNALQAAGMLNPDLRPRPKFYSIECNPRYFAVARSNCMSYPVLLQQGLSIPRSLLPDKAKIQEEYVVKQPSEDIFVDGMEGRRADEYHAETDFAGADDLLDRCLTDFDYCPDFLLLDSAGHIGFIEFTYVIPKLKAPCLIVLDDTKHVKHYETMKFIKANPKEYKIIVESDEKFGFAVVEYNPFPPLLPVEGKTPLAIGVLNVPNK